MTINALIATNSKAPYMLIYLFHKWHVYFRLFCIKLSGFDNLVKNNRIFPKSYDKSAFWHGHKRLIIMLATMKEVFAMSAHFLLH